MAKSHKPRACWAVAPHRQLALVAYTSKSNGAWASKKFGVPFYRAVVLDLSPAGFEVLKRQAAVAIYGIKGTTLDALGKQTKEACLAGAERVLRTLGIKP